MNGRNLRRLIGQTWHDGMEARVPRLAAALVYHTLFSLAPLLLILAGILGMVLGPRAAMGQLHEQVQALVGTEGAKAVEVMLAHAAAPKHGLWASLIGALLVVYGATNLFAELQDAMNTLWQVPAKPSHPFRQTFHERLLSFAMVLMVAAFLFLSLIASTSLSLLGRFVGGGVPLFWQVANQLVSVSLFTLLFAMLFKFLPDVHLQWRDVWLGGLVTATLFTLGKYLIGLYLAHSGVSSVYGAAGSLVVLLVWVYYSAQIFFLGAEFTRVYTLSPPPAAAGPSAATWWPA